MVHECMRVLLVFVHLLAVTVGLGSVLRQDWLLWRHRRINIAELIDTHHIVAWALMVMWLSGLLIISMDTNWLYYELIARPKLLAKLTVVVVLTLNAGLIHVCVIPALQKWQFGQISCIRPSDSYFMCIIGSVSAASWLYAVFLGLAKPLVFLDYREFMWGYFMIVSLGLVFSMAFIHPRIMSMQAHR